MAKILRDLADQDDDFVSLSDYALSAQAELDAHKASMAQAARNAAAVLSQAPTRAERVDGSLRAALADPERSPSIYERIHNCIRVSPAEGEVLCNVRKTKSPEMSPLSWRRPGIRFVPPKKRVVL